MLRTSTARLRPGMRLALPVMNPAAPSQPLLRMNFVITDGSIRRLNELGVRQVWVRYPGLDQLDAFLNLEAAQARSELTGRIAEAFELVRNGSAAKLGYDQYASAVSTLVDQLMRNPRTAVFLGDLVDADDELLRHSASVAYLSVLMGLKLESYLVRQRPHVPPHRAKEVVNLGLGAMLHDLGLSQLPHDKLAALLAMPDESDDDWRQHPARGFDLVRGRIEPTAAAVVLHHHQRYDGKGFAGGEHVALSGPAIHVFARIVAVADTFDRFRRPGPTTHRPTARALELLLDADLAPRYDPAVVAVLLQVVPPFAPGTLVQLTDGRHALVIDHDPRKPLAPTVQLLDDPAKLDEPDADLTGPILDLREAEDGLRIAAAEGEDVRDIDLRLPEGMLLAA
jgi:HD-GYP domain-containing protein (c-di-GMP phosphodiesterase class II)